MLYERYKRFKAKKTILPIGKSTLKLFNVEFTDEQMLAISEYDHTNDIKCMILVVFMFILGAFWGIAQVL